MPASAQSLRLEQEYGRQVGELWRQIVALVRQQFLAIDPDALEASFRSFIATAAGTIELGQRDAQQLAAGFVSQYVEAEADRAFRPVPTSASISGATPDGASLRSGLSGAVGIVWLRLSQGAAITAALAMGELFVARLAAKAVADAADLEIEHQAERAPRQLVRGWTWQTVGDTCVACLARLDGSVRPWSAVAGRHPHCDCLRVPIITGAPDTVPRPTGAELFARMTPAAQAAVFKADGDAKAAAVRAGRATLADFAATDRTAAGPIVAEAA